MSTNTLMTSLLANQYNPIGMARVILDELVDVTAGNITVVDTTNPPMFVLQSACCLTAAAMTKNESNSRMQYPSLAQTITELYHHMSDEDYINRFAVPSKAKVTLVLSLSEVLSKLVTDPATGIKKIVIPRNTEFMVGGVAFSIQYPIEIRQLMHGGFQIVYDASTPSPLQELSTNLLPWQISNYSGDNWILIDIDVTQIHVTSYTQPVNSATAFTLDITINDSFYYARVYEQATDGTWSELKTTHSDLVYDVRTPTARLNVSGSVLNVTIPQIYINSNLINGYIRVDLYETKGALELDLSSYPAESFSVTWQTFDKNDNTSYVAPLRTLRALKIFSDKVSYGGRAELSFEELRNRVINNNVGPQVIPITPSQAQAALQDSGYDIVKNIDNLTDRVFLATRSLPKPKNEKLITAASLGMGLITTSLNDALSLSSVIDNGTSVTITPDTLYESNSGIISILSDIKKNTILAMAPDKRALAVTNSNLYYSPFHYILDTTRDEFDARAYYLDNPGIVSKTFVQANDTTLLEVVVDSYSLERTTTGYKLHVLVASSADYKALGDDEVFAQLSFIPHGERNRAYLNATLVGTDPTTKERVFEFELASNMNVTVEDMLQLTMFKMYTLDGILTDTPLENTFDIVFGTTKGLGSQWLPNNVDTMLGKILLPNRTYGINHEQLAVRFGYALSTLWAQSRSVVSTITYETYPADVYATYPEDIQGPDGAISFDAQGNIIYNEPLHKKGDVVVNDGNMILKHRKGEVMISPITGRPIIHEPRSILRQFTLMLVEGAYWFATDSTSIAYRDEINQTVINWLVNDLSAIQKRLLEKTRLYFYPKASLGEIQVMYGSGQINRSQAGQAFQVALYVSSSVYTNALLRLQLETTTIQVISDELKNSTVSMSQISKNLRAQYGDDVIDVRISGLGGDADYPVMTVIDDASRCSLRKRLVAQGDATLIVEEDVTITFIKHEMP